MNKEYSLDELYGISINLYCEIHGKTIEDIIKSVETDIEILYNNYMHYASKKRSELSDRDFDLAIKVSKARDKKKAHLKRLLDYKRNMDV